MRDFKIYDVVVNENATNNNIISCSYTPWVWGLPEGKWLAFGSAEVSCYPWGCGYTVKDSPQGKI